MAQIESKLPICPRRDFGKIDYYYCIPTVFFDATTFKKSPERANNKTEGCIILLQTRCEFLPQTRIFWKSWPLLFWSNFCIQSCHDISKYLSQSSSRVSGYIIFALIVLSPKREIFLENWQIWALLSSNLTYVPHILKG